MKLQVWYRSNGGKEENRVVTMTETVFDSVDLTFDVAIARIQRDGGIFYYFGGRTFIPWHSIVAIDEVRE